MHKCTNAQAESSIRDMPRRTHRNCLKLTCFRCNPCLCLAIACLVGVVFNTTSFAEEKRLAHQAKEHSSDSEPVVGPFVFQTASEPDIGTATIGTLLQDRPLNFKIRLQNSTQSPLILNRVEASCGCVSTGTLRGRILPGESVELPFKVVKSTTGEFGVDVKIYDESDRSWNAKIIGVVLPEFEFIPNVLVLDRELGEGKVVKLRCNNPTVKLTEARVLISGTPNGLQVTLNECSEIRP